MSASTYLANTVIDAFLRGVAPTVPARVYVSLHTADPGNTGANEVSTAAWPSYTRQDPAAAAAIDTGFSAASGKATANLKDMLWSANDGAGSVTVTHFAIWDAATGGNCLFVGALDASRTFNVDDEAVIHPAALSVSVT